MSKPNRVHLHPSSLKIRSGVKSSHTEPMLKSLCIAEMAPYTMAGVLSDCLPNIHPLRML